MSIVPTIVTTYVSNRSAAIPAQSPTLSPTLSAITAGLRGSSSGIPASTLPTRSAPTSAPLVKMPPAETGENGDKRSTERKCHQRFNDRTCAYAGFPVQQYIVIASDAKQ